MRAPHSTLAAAFRVAGQPAAGKLAGHQRGVIETACLSPDEWDAYFARGHKRAPASGPPAKADHPAPRAAFVAPVAWAGAHSGNGHAAAPAPARAETTAMSTATTDRRVASIIALARAQGLASVPLAPGSARPPAPPAAEAVSQAKVARIMAHYRQATGTAA